MDGGIGPAAVGASIVQRVPICIYGICGIYGIYAVGEVSLAPKFATLDYWGDTPTRQR
jgi:hypothetical protein